MSTSSNRTWPRFPVAIVGMACRLPGARNIDEFWELLRSGTNAVTEVPKDRWDVEYFYHPDPTQPGKSYVRWGGYLRDIDAFDANFFGISPREARQMDPQQRILLELTWEALENADVVPASLAGSDTSVFIGAANTDYGILQRSNIEILTDPYGISGSAASVTANRLSHFLDLGGPSLAIDTACSSALVAVHKACESLWTGESALAIAGGINIILLPESMVGFSKAAMLSPRGRCATFDAAADGYVRSEGGGVVVLKPLDQALADGNPIQAVLLGSAVNSDGRTKGIALPNPVAQEKLLRRLYESVGVDPAEVNYVEAHGTGTNAGDRVECAALGRVFGAARPADRPCRIGSAKTNVGHLEPASGIVGLLKAILTLKHRAIPPTVHFRRPNPKIPFGELNLSVVAELTPLPADGPLIAGVSSFGFGGTNAHVILRSPDPGSTPAATGPEAIAPLFLSARSSGALKAMAQSYAELLKSADSPPLSAVCCAAALRRSHHSFRIATFGAAAEEVASRLEAFASEQPALMLAESEVRYQNSRLAFVFSGNGSQWLGMGRDLLAQEPAFAEYAQRIDTLLRPLVGWSLLEVLQSDESSNLYDKTEIAQPALFAIQVGIVELLRLRGITAEAMVGHSVGEIAAAYAAGALTLEQACRVIAIRSQAQGRTAGAGTMAAVGLSDEQALEAIAAFEGALTLATINSPNSVTLAGDRDSLEALRLMLKPRGAYCRLLGLDYAFHSAVMDPIRDDILQGLADLRPQPGRYRFISGVTGSECEGAKLDAAYWWDNIRKPVQFAKSIHHLVESGIDVFVEVGPHPILAGYLRECLQSRSGGTVAIPTLRRGEGERDALWMTVARCYTAGVPLDYAALFPKATVAVPLPAYPWQKERYWYAKSDRVSLPNLGPRQHPLLGYRTQTVDLVWRNQLDAAKLSYLADHVVQGSAVFPASGYAELALAAATLHLQTEAVEVEGLEIRRPLLFSGKIGPWVEFELAAEELSFRIISHDKFDAGQAPIAVGRIGAVADDAPRPAVTFDELRDRLRTRVSAQEHYQRCAAHGLTYGTQFRSVSELWIGSKEALARIAPPEAIASSLDGYRLHPVLLDGCLQAVAGAIERDAAGEDTAAYVPTTIDRLRLFGHGSETAWCHVTVSHVDRNGIVANFALFGADGDAIADLSGVRFRRLGSAKSSEIPAWHWELHLQPGRASGGSAADLPGALDLAASLRRAVEAVAERAERSAAAAEVAPALGELAARYARRVLDRIGLDGTPKAVAMLLDHGGLSPEYGRYLENLLRLARNHGLAAELPAGWKAAGALAKDEPEALWRNLLAQHPDWLAGLELIARCGEQAMAVLVGDVDAEPILAPERDFDAAEQLQDADPWFRLGNEIIAEAIQRIGAATPVDRPLRIIEAGGGSGALTAAILPSLPAGRVDYLFTDPNEAVLSHAQGRFADHGFMRFAALDLNRDPAAQGFEPAQADIIVANHVLTNAEEAGETATRVKSLLKPGGLLILVEARPSLVLDFAFGLSRRRWFYTDVELRPESPLLPAARWAALLRAVGFTDSAVLGDDFSAIATPVVLARNATASGHTAAEPAIERRRWILLAGAGDARSAALAERLRQMSQRVTIVIDGPIFERLGDDIIRAPLATREDYGRILAELQEELSAGAELVYASGMARRLNGAALDPLTAQERGSFGLLLLVQALAARGMGGGLRLWTITRGALAAPGGSGSIDPVQAPIWGVARSLQNERSDLAFRLVDISPADSDEVALRMLVNELLWPSPEDEVVLRGTARYVHRLQQGMPVRGIAEKVAESESTAYKLMLRPGARNDGLALTTTPMPAPKPGEVLIRVAAAGLNYRDVLQRVGILPQEAFEGGFAGAALGMEFAGEVVALGAGVTHFKAGDGIFGFAPGAFASHLSIPADMLFSKPASLSFEAAATIPVAALTAYYSLHHVAHLQPGERVLVHGAAGGVGLAAIQYARSIGAEIFATAGTPAKRAYLRRLGVEHVLDSRSLAFADQIRLITKGEGVDVVLNSLAGEALHKGVSLLRPYGRFIELGKRDFWANTKLGLQPFRNNIQFSGVDVDRLLVDRPALARQLLRELGALIASGKMGALPYRRYPATRAAEAFRHMQQSRHIGKVILGFDRPVRAIDEAPSGGLALSAEATYLVTGGRGGFGLSTAEWLARKGARHLVLIGRSATTQPEAAAALARLRDSGVAVREASLDVADAEGMTTFFDIIGREMPPVRGVVHCAAVIEDAAFANMTAERFFAVLRPKVLGAHNLDRLTRDLRLDFFVMYSSAVTLFGNPGQSNYVAANLYLEAVGAERRAHGLPALVVQWGAIEGVGHLARHAEIATLMSERLGVKMLTPERALARLEAALVAGVDQVAFTDLNWSRLAAMSQLAKAPRYALVRPSAEAGSGEGDGDAGELRERLAAMPESQRYAHIQQLVVNHLAGVLRMPASKLDEHQSLLDLGMDSLMVVELQLAMEQQFAITVSPVEVMDVATVAQLVQRVAQKLGIDSAQQGGDPPPTGYGIEIDIMAPEMLDDVIGDLLEPDADQRATERVT